MNTKIITVIELFIILFIQSTYCQENKKVIFQLYDNGTWEKVDAEELPIERNQEKYWKQFQEAIINKDKNKVAEFFDYPFVVYVGENDESKSYKSLEGSYSKKKFIEKYDLIFDKKFIDRIIKQSSDVYEKFEGCNSYMIDFNRSGDLFYEIRWFDISMNQLKIGLIQIGYVMK